MPNRNGWEDAYIEEGRTKKWPSTQLVRIFFGDFTEKVQSEVNGNMTVLDVGCGKGSNLRPFLEAGCECHGVEISTEIANHAESMLSDWGYEATIQEGHNRDLPFDDNTIDILISSNAIHYEKSIDDINEALREFKRVMKPSGVLYITTVGPEWGPLYQSAETIGPKKYRLQVEDFRDGEVMTYFGTHKYFKSVISGHFNTVETGREKSELMGVTRDELICVAQNQN